MLQHVPRRSCDLLLKHNMQRHVAVAQKTVSRLRAYLTGFQSVLILLWWSETMSKEVAVASVAEEY